MLTLLLMWNQIVVSITNGFKSLEKSAVAYSKGWYQMQRAIVSGNIEILKKILQNGESPNLIVKSFESTLNKAIIEES